MKTLLVTLLIAFAILPNAYGQGLTSSEDGVGAGGAGGNPNAMGTTGVQPSGIRPLGVPTEDAGVSTTSLLPSAKTTPGLTKDGAIIVNREELLKAVDAALSSTDLEMQINNATRTVRPQRFDLTRGILQGKILETNKTIRLIDESKASVNGAGTGPAVK